MLNQVTTPFAIPTVCDLEPCLFAFPVFGRGKSTGGPERWTRRGASEVSILCAGRTLVVHSGGVMGSGSRRAPIGPPVARSSGTHNWTGSLRLLDMSHLSVGIIAFFGSGLVLVGERGDFSPDQIDVW